MSKNLKNIIKSSLLISCLLSTGNTYSSDFLREGVLSPKKEPRRHQMHRVHNLHQDDDFFTLAPDVKYFGPLFNEDDRNQSEEYIKQTFRYIVSQAHDLIEDHPVYGYEEGSNANFSYYSFLILALATPHHESKLTHFRTGLGKNCVQSTNDLTHAKKKVQRHLLPIYRDHYSPLFPNCDFFNQNDEVVQVLTSGSQPDDLGIMQLNARFHKITAEPAILLNTKKAIEYGLEYLFDGFIKIRANYKNYTCNFNENPFSKFKGTRSTVYLNIVRATWGGKYNQGRTSDRQVCRFANPAHPTYGHDVVLKRYTLEPMLFEKSSIYHNYLPEGSVERNAFIEIVDNFRAAYLSKSVPEKNTHLKQLLAQEIASEEVNNWSAPERSQHSRTHIIKSEKEEVTLYSSPRIGVENVCGEITAIAPNILPEVTVKKVHRFTNRDDMNKAEYFAEVELPKYASFKSFYSLDTKVVLKDEKNAVNMRSVPSTKDNEPIATLKRKKGRSFQGELISTVDVGNALWFKTKVDDKEGYVHSSLTEVVDSKIESSNECQNRKTYFTSLNNLKVIPKLIGQASYTSDNRALGTVLGPGSAFVRKGDDSKYDIKTTLEIDDELFVIGDNGKEGRKKWYQVSVSKDGDSIIGWLWAPRVNIIHLDYQEDVEPETQVETTSIDEEQAPINVTLGPIQVVQKDEENGSLEETFISTLKDLFGI